MEGHSVLCPEDMIVMTDKKDERNKRAGVYTEQPAGYRAFVPRALPPDPKVELDYEMADLLSKANRSLGRLDGSTDILPNPDLFVAMYVRKEAIISSQIEGTQASLEDVLAWEVVSRRRRPSFDVTEVVNHVRAMDQGVERLKTSAIGSELLRELHILLMDGVRGKEKSPGLFRQVQNWIGSPGSTIHTATFVPPPPVEVERAMADLEAYIRGFTSMPLLIKCGLVHAQFETIHPFLDGNGRLGRLLVTLLLCKHEVLARPLLYLSAYFKQNRDEYYSLLQKVRDTGDWESWLKFFLTGIWLVSEEAFDTARQIIAMREQHRKLVLEQAHSSTKALLLLDHLFEEPMAEINDVAQLLDITYPAASNLVTELGELDLLRETTGQQRNRRFVYEPYLALLRRGTELEFETILD
ncbi:MAG: Fic family protein [Chloroflexota bacterium]|nr:Fic family protein [Chloroflexota bacterium]